MVREPGPKINGVLDAALAYLRASLSFLPVARDGTKRPDAQLLPRVLGDDG